MVLICPYLRSTAETEVYGQFVTLRGALPALPDARILTSGVIHQEGDGDGFAQEWEGVGPAVGIQQSARADGWNSTERRQRANELGIGHNYQSGGRHGTTCRCP